MLKTRPLDVYLPPGLLHAAPAPCVISTVLGSCVSLCLWSKRLRVGGMNHYLLPRGAEGSARFGEPASAQLLAHLQSLGAGREELVARIYGGATILTSLPASAHLGGENVEVARRFAREHRIRVIDEDVLGRSARRIVFDIADGHADVASLGAR